jgi:hypothetical protein
MKPAKRQCFCCSAVGRQVAGGSVVACVVMVGSFLRASGRSRGRATADGWPSQRGGKTLAGPCVGGARRAHWWPRCNVHADWRPSSLPAPVRHICASESSRSAISARRRRPMLADDLRRTATGAGGEARRFWWGEAGRQTGDDWLRSFCSGWRRKCARPGPGALYARTTILPWRWPDWLASSAAAVCDSG